MHFTVVFRSRESADLSCGVVFNPTPTLLWDGHEVRLRSTGHRLERGDFLTVFHLAGFDQRRAKSSKDALIVIHDNGGGTDDDLATLRADLEEEGYGVQQVRLERRPE
jgi:hypothetical protein